MGIVQKSRHFIFFSDEQLAYMAKAHNWYIDGTFKIVKDPIKQLVTIHVVLVYHDSKRVSIPVCFILMTRRRKCDYVMGLDFIRRQCNQYLAEYNLCNNLLRIMADFEIALWQAIREVRNNGNFRKELTIKGCYFHLTQAIFRKVIQNNLQPAYYDKECSNIRLYIKWLMALCLLPPNAIAGTFNLIFIKVKNSNVQNLIHLFTYFEKTWLTNSNWILNEITQWKKHIRTNNDAERFHMKLMNAVQRCNVDFYELVNILGDIGNHIPLTIKLLSQGMINSIRRKKQKKFETILNNASNDLIIKKISAIQFLNIISESNHDNQIINHDWGC